MLCNVDIQLFCFVAAHCIGSEQRLYMELGKYDLSDFLEVGYEVRISEKIITHPEYRPNTGHADIAIITFQKSISFTDKVSADKDSMCMPVIPKLLFTLTSVIAHY